MDKSTSILIVGGSGTFGLSTAWHLAREGYYNILCIDRWPVPSPSSAGWDRNKIVRTEYSHPVYSKLSQEAIDLWRTPIFKDVFFQSGWIFGTDGTEELGRASNFAKALKNTQQFGDATQIEVLKDWTAATTKCPLLASSPGHDIGKEGFTGIFNGNAGWVKPIDAMVLIAKECERMGVRFVGGEAGLVEEFLRAEDGKKIVGVKAKDGSKYYADKIVLAVGSYSDTLLDFKGQLHAAAYVVTHIKLSEEQYQRYKDLPVLNISRRGYCFPPNDDRVLKVCNTDISYLNVVKLEESYQKWGPVSVPRDGAYHPKDTQPTEAEEVTRQFLEYILPELADAPVDSSRLCWDMESHDYNWLLDYHPESPSTLFIATGGSGHSFKNLPSMGRYVMHGLEGKLNPEHRELWRWRPDRIGKDPESEERASRPILELKNAVGWNHDDEPIPNGNEHGA